eukprot:361422_1
MNYTDMIQKKHIIAMMVYCNYDTLQQKLSETYRKTKHDETDDELKERHRNYYHMGKYLRECVECFGMKSEAANNMKLFNGINKYVTFSSLNAYVKGPFSTTRQYVVAVNFCNDTGLILELNLQPIVWQMSFCESLDAYFVVTCFDCSFLSDYVNEQEIFFIGGLNNFTLKNIIDVQTNRTYVTQIKGIKQATYNCFVDDAWGDTLYVPSNKLEVQMATNLLLKELNYQNTENEEMKGLNIQRSFHNHCINIKQIVFYENNSKNLVQDQLLKYWTGWIQLNTILSLFPNIERIIFDARSKNILFLQDIIIDVLHHLTIHTSKMSKLKCISIWVDKNKVIQWMLQKHRDKWNKDLKKCMDRYQSDYRNYGWMITMSITENWRDGIISSVDHFEDKYELILRRLSSVEYELAAAITIPKVSKCKEFLIIIAIIVALIIAFVACQYVGPILFGYEWWNWIGIWIAWWFENDGYHMRVFLNWQSCIVGIGWFLYHTIIASRNDDEWLANLIKDHPKRDIVILSFCMLVMFRFNYYWIIVVCSVIVIVFQMKVYEDLRPSVGHINVGGVGSVTLSQFDIANVSYKDKFKRILRAIICGWSMVQFVGGIIMCQKSFIANLFLCISMLGIIYPLVPNNKLKEAFSGIAKIKIFPLVFIAWLANVYYVNDSVHASYLDWAQSHQFTKDNEYILFTFKHQSILHTQHLLEYIIDYPEVTDHNNRTWLLKGDLVQKNKFMEEHLFLFLLKQEEKHENMLKTLKEIEIGSLYNDGFQEWRVQVFNYYKTQLYAIRTELYEYKPVWMRLGNQSGTFVPGTRVMNAINPDHPINLCWSVLCLTTILSICCMYRY